jgi:maltodextrin utilization protein YvdJ
MLSTIVLSLLAVWLTILIACQVAGIVLGVKFFNALNTDEKDKS